MKILHISAVTLVLVGALNWGLIGLFGFNLVSAIFGGWPGVERLIYVLVGLAAVWKILAHKKYCKMCSGKK